jgi:hypothetical protein
VISREIMAGMGAGCPKGPNAKQVGSKVQRLLVVLPIACMLRKCANRKQLPGARDHMLKVLHAVVSRVGL